MKLKPGRIGRPIEYLNSLYFASGNYILAMDLVTNTTVAVAGIPWSEPCSADGWMINENMYFISYITAEVAVFNPATMESRVVAGEKIRGTLMLTYVSEENNIVLVSQSIDDELRYFDTKSERFFFINEWKKQAVAQGLKGRFAMSVSSNDRIAATVLDSGYIFEFDIKTRDYKKYVLQDAEGWCPVYWNDRLYISLRNSNHLFPIGNEHTGEIVLDQIENIFRIFNIDGDYYCISSRSIYRCFDNKTIKVWELPRECEKPEASSLVFKWIKTRKFIFFMPWVADGSVIRIDSEKVEALELPIDPPTFIGMDKDCVYKEHEPFELRDLIDYVVFNM